LPALRERIRDIAPERASETGGIGQFERFDEHGDSVCKQARRRAVELAT
jgi:hypothetical protein